MPFPEIEKFPLSHPGPYEREMGRSIVRLLELFCDCVPDRQSNQAVLELAKRPDRWSAGHAVFDEIRNRVVSHVECDFGPLSDQYVFEEACCQAIYNASEPVDPFDPSSAFYVAPFALELANLVDVPVDVVVAVLTRRSWGDDSV